MSALWRKWSLIEVWGECSDDGTTWERERSFVLIICCVYMPTEGSAAAVIEDSYERLKEDVLEYQQKGRVVLLGFNARVGKSTDIDDVTGIFGEDTCNRNGIS